MRLRFRDPLLRLRFRDLPLRLRLRRVRTRPCAPNGAAPAVQAAVAAPSVKSTAKPAPQAANFLYGLLIPPPVSWLWKRPTQVASGLLQPFSVELGDQL